MDPVIATGMAKDPDQRYATTIELTDAARHALTTPDQHDADTILASTQAARHPAAPAANSDPGQQAGTSPDTADASAKLPAVRNPSKLGDRLAWAFPALALLFVAILITVIVGSRSSQPSAPSSPPSQAVHIPQPPKTIYKPQIELPFTGLKNPNDVAVDTTYWNVLLDHGS